MDVVIGIDTGTTATKAIAVLYFIPLLLSSAAISITYKALLDPNFGIGTGLGLDLLNQDWLGDATLAMGVLIFVISWQFIPFHSLIYQGGVRQIPVSMYEAAQIDGAGRIRQFFSITLPQLKYTIITSSTLMARPPSERSCAATAYYLWSTRGDRQAHRLLARAPPA